MRKVKKLEAWILVHHWNETISSRRIDHEKAHTPFEWKRKPTRIELDKEVVELVENRWKEYGL